MAEIGRHAEAVQHGRLFDTPNAAPVHLPAEAVTPLPLPYRKRVWTDLARIFSTVCNPFVTSLALFVILAAVKSRTTTDFWLLLFNSAIFTSIGPMLYVFWLYATGRISDLDMSIRAERERVFVVFVIFFALGTIDLWLIGAPAIITASMAGYAVSSLIVQWITRYWKISTHALGITAPLIALCVIYGTRPLPFLVLIPIVCWARVYLRAHTVLQVIAGVGLATVSTLVVFRLFHVV
jgi:membrane-associated phospholipid phosphatase